MFSQKCSVLESTLSSHLPTTLCLPGDSSGSCHGYKFSQRPWLGFYPRSRGILMRRPLITQRSLWSSCQATGFPRAHTVGGGACCVNAIKKAHAQVHAGRDRHTHMHLFLSHLPQYLASICLMERILNAVISLVGILYQKKKSFCLSFLESSSLLLLWVNSVCLKIHLTDSPHLGVA